MNPLTTTSPAAWIPKVSPTFILPDDTSPMTCTGTDVPPGTTTMVEAMFAGAPGATAAVPGEGAARAIVGISNAKNAAVVRT